MSKTLYNIMGDDCDGSAAENSIDRDTLVFLTETSLPGRIAYDRGRLSKADDREVVRLKRSIERRTRQIAKYRGIIALIDMGGM